MLRMSTKLTNPSVLMAWTPRETRETYGRQIRAEARRTCGVKMPQADRGIYNNGGKVPAERLSVISAAF